MLIYFAGERDENMMQQWGCCKRLLTYFYHNENTIHNVSDSFFILVCTLRKEKDVLSSTCSQ